MIILKTTLLLLQHTAEATQFHFSPINPSLILRHFYATNGFRKNISSKKKFQPVLGTILKCYEFLVKNHSKGEKNTPHWSSVLLKLFLCRNVSLPRASSFRNVL